MSVEPIGNFTTHQKLNGGAAEDLRANGPDTAVRETGGSLAVKR